MEAEEEHERIANAGGDEPVRHRLKRSRGSQESIADEDADGKQRVIAHVHHHVIKRRHRADRADRTADPGDDPQAQNAEQGRMNAQAR